MLSNKQMRQFAEFETLFKVVKDMRDDLRFEVNSDMQREQVEKRPFFDDKDVKLGSITCVMDSVTDAMNVEIVDRKAFAKWVAENIDSLLYDEVAQTVFNYTGEVPNGCDTVTVRKVKKGYVRAYPTKEYKAVLEKRAQSLLEGGEDAR